MKQLCKLTKKIQLLKRRQVDIGAKRERKRFLLMKNEQNFEVDHLIQVSIRSTKMANICIDHLIVLTILFATPRYDINKDEWIVLTDDRYRYRIRDIMISDDNPNIIYITSLGTDRARIIEIDLRIKNCESKLIEYAAVDSFGFGENQCILKL